VIVVQIRDEVLELHLDTKSARALYGALVQACPQGEAMVDLGRLVRVCVHGVKLLYANPQAKHPEKPR